MKNGPSAPAPLFVPLCIGGTTDNPPHTLHVTVVRACIRDGSTKQESWQLNLSVLAIATCNGTPPSRPTGSVLRLITSTTTMQAR